MNDEKKIRKFILVNFWITLIFAGIAEAIINYLFRVAFGPVIEKLMSVEGLMNEKTIQDSMLVLACGLVILFASKSSGVFAPGGELVVNGFLRRLFNRYIGDDALRSIWEMFRTMSLSDMIGYSILFTLCIAIVVIVWAAPFVVAGMIFSKRVHGKITLLIQLQKEREAEFDRRRNLLISDIAHDIKTPITTVAGFARALSDGAVPKEQGKEYLEAIYLKSMRVSELVSLLLEYSKLDSEGYSLKKSQVDYCELVRECVAAMYPDFEEKSMELDIDIPDKSIMAEIDTTQIARAISNILVNTIRHNPEGTKVSVKVMRRKDYAVLEIADNGVRIDRDKAEHLFEPFVQADESRTVSGSGLGLSICKKIVEMHGGKVRLIQYSDPARNGWIKTFEIWLKA